MASKTCEELYIRCIENAMRGIRIGGKSPIDVNPAVAFEKLKDLNFGMHQDLLGKYQKIVNDYNNKKKQHEAKQPKGN